MSKRPSPKFRSVIDKGEYERLQDMYPDLADQLAEEIAQGVDAEEFARYIKAEYGTNRDGLAKLVRNAARYLQERTP